MHGAVSPGPFLAGDLIGFTTGLAISILLLILTLRALRLPGTPLSNLMVAACSLMWNLGGLASAVAVAPGVHGNMRLALAATALQFSGAAIWPVPVIAIWRQSAERRWQKIGSQILQTLAIFTAVAITGSLWAVAFSGRTILSLVTLKEFTSYNGFILAAAGAVLLIRGRRTSRAFRLSSIAILWGLFSIMLIIFIQNHVELPHGLNAVLSVLSKQMVLLLVLGAFFLFGKFRFADVFIRAGVRILLASVLAAALVPVSYGFFAQNLSSLTVAVSALQFSAVSILVASTILFFGPLDRVAGNLVNRWIFHAPDYRNAIRELGEKLRQLNRESDIAEAVESAARKTLEVDSVQSIPIDRLPKPLWPPDLINGEIAELGAATHLREKLSLSYLDLLIPIRTEGRVSSALAISPGPARGGLVTQELNYLRTIAMQFGSRIDGLRMENEMVERQNRETRLLQQVTEAELRALRAQINPHFLFNSLNAIANLIVTDPGQAEAMTLGLAKVFRHVLAHSSRPLIPIQEEIDFLRTYLQIEEVRFGDRLRVEIAVDPEVARASIPSLILQPLVENALKHGLGPKPGPGHLWISAQPDGEQICLKIEDDGIGPHGSWTARTNGDDQSSGGVGLENIRLRLATLYQGHARMNLQARETGGTRVTMFVPRSR